MPLLSRAELQDLRDMERLATAIHLHVGALRSNMAEEDTHDRIRFLKLAEIGTDLADVAIRGARRFRKHRDAAVFRVDTLDDKRAWTAIKRKRRSRDM